MLREDLEEQRIDDDESPESPLPSTIANTNIVNTNRIHELETLVHDLLENNEDAKATNGVKFNTIDEAFHYLKRKLSDERERLRVAPMYALEDALGFFKANDFKPDIRLSITYKGQSAVDAGGVLRQFYTDVFRQLTTGCGDIAQLFEGKERRLLPVHNAGVVLSGLMELVGKILAHAIVHASSGMSSLCPAVYRYIVCGEVSETSKCVCIEDTINLDIIDYARRVKLLPLPPCNSS